MTDVTGVPFEVLSDVLSDPAAVLFGLEAEFNVLSVDRTSRSAVKLIIEQISREGPCPACGVLSSAVKDRPLCRVKDLPACGQQVELWWRKRRLLCRESLCPRRSFTQTCAAVRPRARVMERLRDKLASAIAGSNRPVTDVAAEYGVSWPTAHKALVAAAAKWLPEPTPTTRLGIDETRFRSVRWILDGITWKRSDPWLTSFVDCTSDGLGSLLGLAPGRTGGCVKDWLAEQTPAFRNTVEIVIIDPSAPYASGIRAALPRARIAVDKWHLVALANAMVTEVRQRVTRDQLGRRGRNGDPLWVNRNLLLTGAEHLSAKQWRRFTTMLDTADPTGEIGAAGGVKEGLRMLLAEHETEPHPVATGRLLRRRDRRRPARSDPARRHHPDLVAGHPGRPHQTRHECPHRGIQSDRQTGQTRRLRLPQHDQLPTPYPDPHRGHPTARSAA